MTEKYSIDKKDAILVALHAASSFKPNKNSSCRLSRLEPLFFIFQQQHGQDMPFKPFIYEDSEYGPVSSELINIINAMINSRDLELKHIESNSRDENMPLIGKPFIEKERTIIELTTKGKKRAELLCKNMTTAQCREIVIFEARFSGLRTSHLLEYIFDKYLKEKVRG